MHDRSAPLGKLARQNACATDALALWGQIDWLDEKLAGSVSKRCFEAAAFHF